MRGEGREGDGASEVACAMGSGEGWTTGAAAGAMSIWTMDGRAKVRGGRGDSGAAEAGLEEDLAEDLEEDLEAEDLEEDLEEGLEEDLEEGVLDDLLEESVFPSFRFTELEEDLRDDLPEA